MNVFPYLEFLLAYAHIFLCSYFCTIHLILKLFFHNVFKYKFRNNFLSKQYLIPVEFTFENFYIDQGLPSPASEPVSFLQGNSDVNLKVLYGHHLMFMYDVRCMITICI